MADPITSTETTPTYVDPDWNTEQTTLGPSAAPAGSSAAPPGTSAEQPPAGNAPSAGTSQLVDSFEEGASPETHARPLEGRAADNVDARRAETPMQMPYADAGITESLDSAYAEGALVFGAQNGVELSALQVSGQVGRQTEVNGTLFSMSATTPDGTTEAGISSFSATFGAGVEVGDEAALAGASAHATLLSVEVNQDLGSGNSLTVGAGLGVGFEGSAGTTNTDGDNYDEYCLQVSAFGMTAGGCLELGQVAEAGYEFLSEALTGN